MLRWMPIRYDRGLARNLAQVARLRIASFPPPYARIWVHRFGQASAPPTSSGQNRFQRLSPHLNIQCLDVTPLPPPLAVKIVRQVTHAGPSSLFDGKMENQNSGNMKTTLDLPSDLVQEIKLRADNEGKKLKDVISDLLRRGLGQSASDPGSHPGRRGTIVLPLFPTSPTAPATRMELEELQALEHDTLNQADLESIHPAS